MINGTAGSVSAFDAARAAAAEFPGIGTPIFLVLGEGVNFRSRLESIEGGAFEVAAPLETTGPVIELGHEFEIFWAPPRTRIMLPCRLTGISDGAPFRWTLAPTANARQSNRREYVRGGGGAAVRLDADTIDRPVEGALLDISEGGLRCWIDVPASVAHGDQMRATVGLGATDVELSGTVHTVRDAPDGDPGQHVILTFDAKENVAQVIRRYVLSWEVGERRLSQHGGS
jgi:hypothetical protein